MSLVSEESLFWPRMAEYGPSEILIFLAFISVHLQIKSLRCDALNMVSLNLFLFTVLHVIFLMDSLGGDVPLTHDDTWYQHSLSGGAKVKPFDPKVTCKQECLITTFQEVYFVSESFEEAKEKMRYLFFFPVYKSRFWFHAFLSSSTKPFYSYHSFMINFHGVGKLRLAFAWSSMYWLGKIMNYITIRTIYKKVNSLEKWLLILTAYRGCICVLFVTPCLFSLE